MGYNTTIIVMNDAVHNMDQDPEFAKKLKDAIQSVGARNPERTVDVSILGHVNAVGVVASAHADVMQVIAIGGNTAMVLGNGHWSNSEHQLLRKLAEQHGFRLVRDPKFKTNRWSDRKCRDCTLQAPYGTCMDCKEPLMKTTYGFVCPKDPDHRR